MSRPQDPTTDAPSPQEAIVVAAHAWRRATWRLYDYDGEHEDPEYRKLQRDLGAAKRALIDACDADTTPQASVVPAAHPEVKP